LYIHSLQTTLYKDFVCFSPFLSFTMFGKALAVALSLASIATAVEAPNYSGFTRIWQETFAGSAGSSPNGNNWEIRQGDLGVNNELQIYTSSNTNLQLSGGSTLQIVPRRDGSAAKGWTSGRIESRYTFTPGQGEVTRAEAQIRFGDGNSKQGIWPAFWQLGESIRHGVGWPACGEIDILETVNGILTGYGTVHCGQYPGGPCNEPNGIGGAIGIPDQSWHTWRVDYDRRSGNWRDQSITWFMDGRQFHQVTGNRIGDAGVWSSLAQSPLFFILNVAVGGDWVSFVPVWALS
jgi:beta-glucanase (GH16 family)